MTTGFPSSLFALVLCVHLGGVSLPAQKVDPYAGKPDWYRPGHPLDPAEPSAIKTLPGFEVEKLLSIPRKVGSLTTMTVDTDGSLIVATQHMQGLHRITPSPIGSEEPSRLEPMTGEAAKIGWSQGLLHAFGSLYVTVAETNPTRPTGLYRLIDTDEDGEYDMTVKLLALDGAGEHGPHNLVVGPDGKSLYLICGNGTPVPKHIAKRKTVRTSGDDHLMPPEFGNTRFTDGAWVLRLDPDGGNPELFAGGMRNPYDLAFNRQGDLFTFDSDMEYDLGMPWYRPNRICQIVSGAEFGWRASAGKWPEHYADSVQPVVNIGLASPTGVLFGYDSAFPGKYREALFALDWTFAVIYAVHLDPSGAGYTATVEEFASGVGLPLTDLVFGKDGAMYFCVGGRKLGAAVYRIWYSGEEEVTRRRGNKPAGDAHPDRALRLRLESWHGKKSAAAVEGAWPHLGHPDPVIRYAARLALESQPVARWKDRAQAERNQQTKLTALLALARQAPREDLSKVIDALAALDVSALPEDTLLTVLRIHEVVLARGGEEFREPSRSRFARLRKLLPHKSTLVNRELSRLLCYLRDTSGIDPLLDLMGEDTGETVRSGSDLVERNLVYGAALLGMMESAPMVERMHHAQMLTWLRDGWTTDQRRRYFQLVVEAIATTKGGVGYKPAWEQILDAAKAALSEEERKILSPIWTPLDEVAPLPTPKGPGRLWEMEYLLKQVENGFGHRDYANGKMVFSAATCATCHSMAGAGGVSGPDLTALAQRFTIKDILTAIVDPSEAISDQYQMMTIALKDGEVVTGRVYSKDADQTVLSPNVMKPNVTRSIPHPEIASVTPLPVSTMPPALLNSLNEEEVLDLLAFLVAGGQSGHAIYRAQGQ